MIRVCRPEPRNPGRTGVRLIPGVMQERDSDGPRLTQTWVAGSLDPEVARDHSFDAGPYISGLPVDTR